MIKQFSLVIILFLSPVLFAQVVPGFYNLQDEKNLSKINTDFTPSSNSISDIITIGDTVWLGTSRGVNLSTDRGATWKNFYNTEAFGTESISAIGYYKGTFWAGTAHDYQKDGQSLPEGSGLRFTTDMGNTWTTIQQPLDNNGDSVIIYGENHLRALPVTVKVQNLVYDIAFTPGTIWIATFAGGLRKSTDMGQTWQRVILPPDNRNGVKPTDTLNFCVQPVAGRFCSDNNLNYRVFSVIATNDSTLYVGTAGGINKSTDNGISWVKFTHTNQENPISGNFVVALGSVNNNIWAATWKAEGSTEFYGVSTSNDGGNNWDAFLEGEKVHNFGFKNNDVIAVSDNGPFRTTNGGTSWILPGTIKDPNSGLTLSTKVFYSAASQGNDVWLGSSDGLVKLTETFTWSGIWKIYFSSKGLASQSDTYAYPNPFSPKTDLLKIKYSTGGVNKNVSIRIFDFGMNYVRTIIQFASRGSAGTTTHVIDNNGSENAGVIDYWDGKDDSGNIVPNGVYFYRVEFDSGDPVFGKIIVLQ